MYQSNIKVTAGRPNRLWWLLSKQILPQARNWKCGAYRS